MSIILGFDRMDSVWRLFDAAFYRTQDQTAQVRNPGAVSTVVIPIP